MSFECEPEEHDGVRRCGRRSAKGGPCDQGPTADGSCSRRLPTCRPVRSLLGKRFLLTVWLTIAGAGLIALAIGGDARLSFLAPGQLSQAHGASSDDCGDCHRTADESLAALVIAAIDEKTARGENLCLDCHDLGGARESAHGLGKAALARRPRDGQDPTPSTWSSRARIALAARAGGGQTSPRCSVCHAEHRGASADLTDLDDRRCQNCHLTSFSSFEHGHPEFEGYGIRDSPSIRFDHRSHLSRHLPEAKVATACVTCHAGEATGERMGLTDFDTGCAGCHASQIDGRDRAGSKGIALFRLPGLDTESLDSADAHLDTWPVDAEGELTGFTRLLLDRDDDLLVAPLDLLDLGLADVNELAAVRRHVAGFEQTIRGIALSGHVAFTSSLELALGRRITPEEASALIGGLGPSTVEAAVEAWFEGDDPGPTPTRGEDWVDGGGFYLDHDDFAIAYRPTGHADPFLGAWIDLVTSEAPGSAASVPLRAIAEELLDPLAPGACMKCHISQAPTGDGRTGTVNWQRPAEPAALTRFSHAPHLRLERDSGCPTCHHLDLEANASFAPKAKETCIACHTPQRAGSGCLLCHSYHLISVARAAATE